MCFQWKLAPPTFDKFPFAVRREMWVWWQWRLQRNELIRKNRELEAKMNLATFASAAA